MSNNLLSKEESVKLFLKSYGKFAIIGGLLFNYLASVLFVRLIKYKQSAVLSRLHIVNFTILFLIVYLLRRRLLRNTMKFLHISDRAIFLCFKSGAPVGDLVKNFDTMYYLTNTIDVSMLVIIILAVIIFATSIVSWFVWGFAGWVVGNFIFNYLILSLRLRKYNRYLQQRLTEIGVN